jgi:hypothetical protein
MPECLNAECWMLNVITLDYWLPELNQNPTAACLQPAAATCDNNAVCKWLRLAVPHKVSLTEWLLALLTLVIQTNSIKFSV